jgi:hypothetical protein
MASKMHYIKTSQSDITCTKCGDVVPKGSPYCYFKPGFRGRAKVRRCMKPECHPTRSERNTSKMGEVYAAQEDAETTIRSLTWSDEASFDEQVNDIEEALNAVAEQADATAEEYDEALQAAPVLEGTVQEKIDALTDYSSELTSWQADEPGPEPEGADGTEERRLWLAECQEHFDSSIETALEALGSLAI